MTVKMPGTTWRPLDHGVGAVRTRTDAVVFHVADTNATTLFNAFNRASTSASCHFYVLKNGTVEQYADLDRITWTSAEGNWRTIGVETQGVDGEPWTAAQVEACGKIAAFVCQIYSLPVRLMDSSRTTEKGIGYHRLGVRGNFPAYPSLQAGINQRKAALGGTHESWSGVIKTCPGNERVAQMPDIVAAAKGQTPSKPKPSSGVKSPSEAVAWASVPRKGYGGLCLRHTRRAYGIPAKYASAREQWKGAKYKHVTSSTADIPYGAPIHLDRPQSQYGHYAIYVGGGKMATTDSSQTYTQVVSISYWERYDWRLIGWSEDLNGVRIPGLAKSSKPGKSKPSTGSKPAKLTVDGKIGVKSTKALQYLAGSTRDGVISGQPRTIRVNGRVADALDTCWPTLNYGKGGSQVVAWMQEQSGAKSDGYAGPGHWKAWQRKVDVKADGVPGFNTAKATQRWINKQMGY